MGDFPLDDILFKHIKTNLFVCDFFFAKAMCFL